MNFKVIKDTLNPLINKAVCICMLSSPLGCQVFFWGGVGGPGEAADKNWNGETTQTLLSLLSFSYIYFLNKLDFLFLLSSFSINKNFLRLFAKEAMSQAKQTPRPQVHLKVGTEHLGCWTSYSARTSFGPFKKKKKKDSEDYWRLSILSQRNNYELFHTTWRFHWINFICKHTFSLTLSQSCFFMPRMAKLFAYRFTSQHPLPTPKLIPSRSHTVCGGLKTIHFHWLIYIRYAGPGSRVRPFPPPASLPFLI